MMYSNAFTALCIAMSITFGFITLYQVIPISLGFTGLLGSIIMLIASMVSILPEETEISIQKEIDEAEHLSNDLV